MKLLERFFLKRSVSISNRALFDPDTNRMTTSAPDRADIEVPVHMCFLHAGSAMGRGP
jgi:hypothetical protein